MTFSLAEETFYRASSGAVAHAALTGEHDASVCVIGAGFAGLATALGLLERGVRDVVVLEAETVGFGASGRNGGFVFGGFSLGNAQLLQQQGSERARAMYQLTLDAVELIRKRIKQYGIDCDANYSGVMLANWFDDDRILQREREFMQREYGVEWRAMNREETRHALRSERYFGALHEQNAFHFHPLKYAQGIAAAIESLDGKIFERSRAIRIETDGAQKTIHTASGKVRCQSVVVCCGGYIERLYPRLARAIMPIATYVMATEALGSRLQDAMQTGAAVYDTRFAFDYYRPLSDSRLLWGGRIAIIERSPEDVAKLLYADLLKVYPQLSGIKVEYAWSGLMSYATHSMPQIGQLPNGLYYGMGFGGHGVGPTTMAGELLAQCLAVNKPLPPGFARYDLPRTWGALGLMGAQMMYWYFELRDWWRQ